MLHHWNAHALAPDDDLLYGSSAEGVGSAEHHLQTCLLELPGELADGCGLTNAIHTNDHHHIRLLALRNLEAFGVASVILCQQGCNLIAQDAIEFGGADILVARHTFLDALDDVQRGINAHIGCHEHFLEIVEHVVIDLALAGYGTCQFAEETLLGLLEAFVERFLLLFLILGEKIEESHFILV